MMSEYPSRINTDGINVVVASKDRNGEHEPEQDAPNGLLLSRVSATKDG